MLIAIENLVKHYTMGATVVRAVDGVSLQIERGGYVAIMGSSGSGKSTLMNLIGCLDTPTAGRYALSGTEVTELTEDERSEIRNREIGFVFQTYNLLARAPALANVELPLIYAKVPHRKRRALAEAALVQVGLADRMRHRPSELSGGQCQRVAVARALVNRPSLLLADEPTGNLDTATGREILALFDTLHSRGNTLIVVTHEEEIARRARRIVRLRDGKIFADEKS